MLRNLFIIPYLKLKYKLLPNKAQAFWAQELLEGYGMGAKLGQVLAQGKVSKLPKASLSFEEAKTFFEKQFNVPITFTGEVYAASIGQVFFVKIKGKDYALKILHPGIKEQLKKEIDNILILGSYYSMAKGFSLDKEVFKRFLNEVFDDETNLQREADFQIKFNHSLASNLNYRIPSIISDFSNENILCQEIIPATLAKDLVAISHYHIFEFFFEALFNHGLLHGDLNDRNWGLDQNDTTVIYDYGCTHRISERRINGLKKLVMNIDIIEGLKEFGLRLEATKFKGQEQKLRDTLYNALFGSPISPQFSLSQYLNAEYGDSIKQLREYSDPWVLLFMRSLFSVIRVYQDKKIEIPLNSIISPYLQLKEKEMKANEIKVEVLESGKQVVFLTLPITALDNIENLMPEKVSSHIQSENIDIPSIIAEVKNSNFHPQQLFSLAIGDRSYKVWIE